MWFISEISLLDVLTLSRLGRLGETILSLKEAKMPSEEGSGKSRSEAEKCFCLHHQCDICLACAAGTRHTPRVATNASDTGQSATGRPGVCRSAAIDAVPHMVRARALMLCVSASVEHAVPGRWHLYGSVHKRTGCRAKPIRWPNGNTWLVQPASVASRHVSAGVPSGQMLKRVWRTYNDKINGHWYPTKWATQVNCVVRCVDNCVRCTCAHLIEPVSRCKQRQFVAFDFRGKWCVEIVSCVTMKGDRNRCWWDKDKK